VSRIDFTIFHLDFIGNRLLIAVIAIFHVYLSQAGAGYVIDKGWAEEP